MDMEGAGEMFSELSRPPEDLSKFVARCADFWRVLSEVNRERNLTRILDWEDFIVKHVFDSLLAVEVFPALASKSLSLIDIGCGGGFPSIPLAMAYPGLSITAVDSNSGKISFVADAAEKLGVSNLVPVRGRGRELARRDGFRKRFDVVTARAVASLDRLFRETRGFIADEGAFLFYKTPEAVEMELPVLLKLRESRAYDWSVSKVLSLPKGLGDRVFVLGSPVTRVES
jgi:16S rRNA (guanine527-N7)-methyltransferase